MINKNKLLLTITILFLGLNLVISIYAQETNSQSKNIFSELVDSIAHKFGLDKDKVQNAMQEFNQQKKQKKQNQFQVRLKKRLDELVNQGKMTVNQENALLKKVAELRSKYSPANGQNLSITQRKSWQEKEREELKAWASANGIDWSLIMNKDFTQISKRVRGKK